MIRALIIASSLALASVFSGNAANSPCSCCTDCRCIDCACDELGCACDQGGDCHCDGNCRASSKCCGSHCCADKN